MAREIDARTRLKIVDTVYVETMDTVAVILQATPPVDMVGTPVFYTYALIPRTVKCESQGEARRRGAAAVGIAQAAQTVLGGALKARD